MDPTDEQLAIIRAINDGHVVVDAVAGSGKTSTIKFIAMTYIKENILALMYNVERRKETTAAMKKYCFNNIEIQTFNSAGYNFYGEDCFNNSALDSVIANNRTPTPFYYNIFILDEVQDKTELYYRFALKLMKDTLTSKPIKLILLGDYMQSINVFNGADIDYILNPERYYPGKWTHLPLSLTFRLTVPMVDLVNALNAESGGRVMRSNKQSSKRPQYHICNDTIVFGKIKEYLMRYSPQDIFVLTPTTRKSQSMTNICNLLTAEGIPIYVTGETYGKGESMNGKLVISTIHVAKGSERKVVFVYGFDDSILPKMLSNSAAKPGGFNDALLYVALTRASEELLIFHNEKRKFIVPKEIIAKYCDVFSSKPIENIGYNRGTKVSDSRSVTDMVKYISYEKIKACKACFSINIIVQAGSNLADIYEIPKLVPSVVAGSSEDISDINGFLIPSYHAGFSYDYNQLRRYFEKTYKNSKYSALVSKSIDAVMNARDNMDDIEAITRAATTYCGLCNNLFYKAEQISSFNWMKKDFLQECSRMISTIGDFVEYEIPAERIITVAGNSTTINGRIDAIDLINNTVYELKCVDQLSDEHILQLALYAFIVPDMQYRLLNVYTGELIELCFDKGFTPSNVAEILV